MNDRKLRRFWFQVDVGLGIGVTEFSEAEARALAESEARRLGRRIISCTPDIDVSTLDPRHVLPNLGPSAVRGIWYPRLNV